MFYISTSKEEVIQFKQRSLPTDFLEEVHNQEHLNNSSRLPPDQKKLDAQEKHTQLVEKQYNYFPLSNQNQLLKTNPGLGFQFQNRSLGKSSFDRNQNLVKQKNILKTLPYAMSNAPACAHFFGNVFKFREMPHAYQKRQKHFITISGLKK